MIRNLFRLGLFSLLMFGSIIVAPAFGADGSGWGSINPDPALVPRLKIVQLLIDASANKDDTGAVDLRSAAEELPFPARGNRKEARKRNGVGLAELGKAQYDAAVKSFEAAAENDRSDAEIVNNLGYAYFKNQRYLDAERVLRLALAMAPGRAAAWGNLGDLFAVTGKESLAMAAYQNAYRFSRAPEKTIAYFQQQRATESNELIKSGLAHALDLITSAKPSANDGSRAAIVARRNDEASSATASSASALSPTPVKSADAQVVAELFSAAKKGDAKAVAALRQLGDKGDPMAQYFAGMAYEYGYGVSSDGALATTWYKRAAVLGLSQAQAALGWNYAHGLGVSKDLEQAARWNRLAAEQGNASAQNNLGVAYVRGAGVEQSFEEAFRWIKKAAESGEAIAQLNLGKMYERGESVPPDDALAFHWYTRSAKQGFASAEFKLGQAYEAGRGIVKNMEDASRWYQKSAVQGFEPARDALKRLHISDY